MGYLRVALALCVVFTHLGAGLAPNLYGFLAVQAFYTISGFYVFLILDGKYDHTWSGYRLFLTNRILRLYPSYAFILILMFACSPIFIQMYFYLQNWLGSLNHLNPTASSAVVFSNITMLGQDQFLFAEQKGDGFAYTLNFWEAAKPAYPYALIPQAWSISIELMFYVIAPLIVRLKSYWIGGIIVASVALRLWIYSQHHEHDPWTYRFFPTELALFLLGGLTYRFSKLKFQFLKMRAIGIPLLIAVLAWTSLYALTLPFLGAWAVPAFLVVTACSLPFLHRSLPSGGVNKFLGELSYPIYLNHMAVSQAMPQLDFIWKLLISVGLAAFMVIVIERPVDMLRQLRVRRSGAARSHKEEPASPAPVQTPAAAPVPAAAAAG